MENNNFTVYQFENYDVEGLKLEINFSNTDFIEIKTHEEINVPIENMEESFEPLLFGIDMNITCLLYTSPSPRDVNRSRMPSSA